MQGKLQGTHHSQDGCPRAVPSRWGTDASEGPVPDVLSKNVWACRRSENQRWLPGEPPATVISTDLMERNWTLIRDLLERLESDGPLGIGEGVPSSLELEGYDEDEVIYHLNLLSDGGFIHMGVKESGRGPLMEMGFTTSLRIVSVLHMGWKGHDLLDQLRSTNDETTPHAAVSKKTDP